MHMKLRSFVLCTLAALLCACAATSVKKTWKSPDAQGSVNKIAALAIAENGLVRQGIENRFVRQLRASGSTALTTFDLLSLPQIKQDKRAAGERLGAAGGETLLLVRLISKTSTYRESRPGSERWAPVMTGNNYMMGWYDYYEVGFMDMSPTYGSVKEWVAIEASLYDLKTEKRLWSGLTETVVHETMDRVEEMDQVVGKMLVSMRKDGVIR